MKVGGPDGNDTLTKPAYINVVSVNTDTKVQNETTASESFPMNPNWEPKDKQHYLNGYDEGYMIGLINGYDHGYDLGIKGLEYTETDRSNFEPKCTTPQDIGYAAGYNAGHKERFLSGYNDGYSIYMQEYMD